MHELISDSILISLFVIVYNRIDRCVVMKIYICILTFFSISFQLPWDERSLVKVANGSELSNDSVHLAD